MTVTEIGKEIKVNYEEVITVNEIMKLKKKWHVLKRKMKY